MTTPINFTVATTIELPDATTGDKASFNVFCNGPCNDVTITVTTDEGDPDLFALDSSKVVMNGNDCSACSGFCSSNTGGSVPESCINLKSNNDSFHVTVYAYSEYKGATINFNHIRDVRPEGKTQHLPICYNIQCQTCNFISQF